MFGICCSSSPNSPIYNKKCLHYQNGNTNAQRVYGFQLLHENMCPQSPNSVLGPFLISFPLLLKDTELDPLLHCFNPVYCHSTDIQRVMCGFWQEWVSPVHLKWTLLCPPVSELLGAAAVFPLPIMNEHQEAQCDSEKVKPAREGGSHRLLPAIPPS